MPGDVLGPYSQTSGNLNMLPFVVLFKLMCPPSPLSMPACRWEHEGRWVEGFWRHPQSLGTS